jgi:hypothetical protein
MRRVAVWLLAGMTLFARPAAALTEQGPPQIFAAEEGAPIAAVTIETYGATTPNVIRRYLSLQKGDRLEQSGVDRDYANLVRLAQVIPRLTIEQDPATGEVTLHWIVMAKFFAPTTHPVYADQPLAFPIEGVGFNLDSPPVNGHGAYFEGYSQLARRASLGQLMYRTPLGIDAASGNQSQVIGGILVANGTFRATQPYAVNIISFFSAAEALYLHRNTNGNQYEFGVRAARSTSTKPTYIVAPSFYDTFYAPARTTTLLAGLGHGCLVPATEWYPPYCSTQYKAIVSDSIGGLGATSEYQTYVADIAHYVRIGNSTLALHGMLLGSGGVVPTSGILCGVGVRGYAKPFCGTDARALQAEYRIDDRLPGNLKFIIFTETAAARVRGGHQAFAPPTFQWHADSGIGVMYRGVRFDLAYGSDGGRLTFELRGQLF